VIKVGIKDPVTEVIEIYDGILKEFAEIDDVEFEKAYDLSKRALVLSDNFINLQLNAGIVRIGDATKSDTQKLFYQKYRTLQLVHEFCRVLWNKGEKESSLWGAGGSE